MEQRNEPTTAEIVKALRCEGDVDKCKDCYFENTELGCVLCSGQEIESLAAARLEQLERENAALTARAEKAEAERDAAVADLEYGMGCTTCKHRPLPLSKKPCKYCMEINYRGNYEWRGLRGKENDGKH